MEALVDEHPLDASGIGPPSHQHGPDGQVVQRIVGIMASQLAADLGHDVIADAFLCGPPQGGVALRLEPPGDGVGAYRGRVVRIMRAAGPALVRIPDVRGDIDVTPVHEVTAQHAPLPRIPLRRVDGFEMDHPAEPRRIDGTPHDDAGRVGQICLHYLQTAFCVLIRS